MHQLGMWAIVVFMIIHIYAAIREDIMSRQSMVSTMISGSPDLQGRPPGLKQNMGLFRPMSARDRRPGQCRQPGRRLFGARDIRGDGARPASVGVRMWRRGSRSGQSRKARGKPSWRLCPTPRKVGVHPRPIAEWIDRTPAPAHCGLAGGHARRGRRGATQCGCSRRTNPRHWNSPGPDRVHSINTGAFAPG
jgi:hypothetical protein